MRSGKGVGQELFAIGPSPLCPGGEQIGCFGATKYSKVIVERLVIFVAVVIILNALQSAARVRLAFLEFRIGKLDTHHRQQTCC